MLNPKKVKIDRLLEILKTVNPKTVKLIDARDVELDPSGQIAWFEIKIGSMLYQVICLENEFGFERDYCNLYRSKIIDELKNNNLNFIWKNSKGEIMEQYINNEHNDQNASDPIDEIVKFQKDRLLDKQPFDFKTEVLNVLEELVEMTGEKSEAARKIAEEIFEKYFENKLIVDNEYLVDSFCDIMVFSVGSLLKLGYDPKCALLETAQEINSRVGKIIDGKFVKDKSPEAQKKWYIANYKKCKKD